MAIKNYRTILFYLILVIILFLLDRFSKLYILNLLETEQVVNVYINQFMNFNLIWNTGIGFGLFSFEADIYYQLTTIFVGIINLLIIYLIFNSGQNGQNWQNWQRFNFKSSCF